MKRRHYLAIAFVVVGALWWRWRSSTVSVNATVTIPEDEIKVTAGSSIYSVQPEKSDILTSNDPGDA